MEFLIGTDPEVFLSREGKFVSAAGLFPGTKTEPFKVEKGAIQVDGLALEFNIDPAKDEEEFVGNIDAVLAQMNDMVKKVDKKFKINFTPYARFDAAYFQSIPDQHKILGCDPDYDFHGRVKNPPEIFERPFRTAAGHVHIGWTKDQDPMSAIHFEDCRAIALRFAQQPFFMKGTVDEARRLEFYGDHGAFRPKSYGVELRSFSNRWVEKEELQRKMYRYIIENMNQMAGK